MKGFTFSTARRALPLFALLVGGLANANPAERVLGFEDPATGVFRSAAPLTGSTTGSPTTGTVSVTFTITKASTFASGSVLNCSVSLQGTQTNPTTFRSALYLESASVSVPVTSSTCTVKIPYSWLLVSGTGLTETFTASYTVSVYPSQGSSGIGSGAPTRSSNATFLSQTSIPASGTSSTHPINVTL